MPSTVYPDPKHWFLQKLGSVKVRPATLFIICSEIGSTCTLLYLFQQVLLRYIIFLLQTSWTRSSAARWLKASHPGTSRCSQAVRIVIVATIVKINHSLDMNLLFPIDGERYSTTLLLYFLLEASFGPPILVGEVLKNQGFLF